MSNILDGLGQVTFDTRFFAQKMKPVLQRRKLKRILFFASKLIGEILRLALFLGTLVIWGLNA